MRHFIIIEPSWAFLREHQIRCEAARFIFEFPAILSLNWNCGEFLNAFGLWDYPPEINMEFIRWRENLHSSEPFDLVLLSEYSIFDHTRPWVKHLNVYVPLTE